MSDPIKPVETAVTPAAPAKPAAPPKPPEPDPAEVTALRELVPDLTWERRHIFQSAGLYEQLPWKVM